MKIYKTKQSKSNTKSFQSAIWIRFPQSLGERQTFQKPQCSRNNIQLFTKHYTSQMSGRFRIKFGHDKLNEA